MVNKRNSTVRAMQINANLLGTFTVIAQFLMLTHNKKMFDLENEGQNDGALGSRSWSIKFVVIPFGGKKNINLYKSPSTHYLF